MTAAEMIERLKLLPPDTQVQFFDTQYDGGNDIDCFEKPVIMYDGAVSALVTSSSHAWRVEKEHSDYFGEVHMNVDCI